MSTYTGQGRRCPMPSITGTLTDNLGLYNNAPTMMMSNATNYGENVHAAVGQILKSGVLTLPPNINPISFERLAINNAIKFIRKYNIEVLDVEETLVWYPNQYLFFTTRSDCLALVDGMHALIDVKTTKNIDKKYCQTQLSAYAYCIYQRYGINIDDLYVMHLPKEGKPKFMKLEKLSIDETLENLKNKKDAADKEEIVNELPLYYNEALAEEIYEIKAYRERMRNYIW